MTLVILVLAFLAGALLVVGLAHPAAHHQSVSARLAQIAGSAVPLPASEDTVNASRSTLYVTLLRRLCLGGASSPALRRLLERAGNPHGLDAAAFQGGRIVCIALFLLLSPLAGHFLGTSLPMKSLAVALILVIGLSLPEAWLQSRIRARQAQIRHALPDTLDLLVVSMEAGVGFDAAVAQTAARLHGPLAQEMERALQEMRLGRTRAEALREMAARVDVAELTGFVSAVTQADRLGSGLAQPLRAQSEAARFGQVQRVREAAARLPTLMLFPLVFFLMPALFVVILGPGLINLLRALDH